jgi:hypothetical protein
MLHGLFTRVLHPHVTACWPWQMQQQCWMTRLLTAMHLQQQQQQQEQQQQQLTSHSSLR